MSSTNFGDQSLCLDASVEAGAPEEDQDEEIGGLINSDGEVVDWDASEYIAPSPRACCRDCSHS